MPFSSTHEKVMLFIETLKGHKNYDGNDAHEIMEEIFMRGNCYKFAKTLQIVFPEAILYSAWKSYGGIAPHHIVAKIDDRFYDIKGEFDRYLWHRVSEMSEKEESFAKAYCYSHKEGGAYNLRDDNDNIIERVVGEELILYGGGIL